MPLLQNSGKGDDIDDASWQETKDSSNNQHNEKFSGHVSKKQE